MMSDSDNSDPNLNVTSQTGSSQDIINPSASIPTQTSQQPQSLEPPAQVNINPEPKSKWNFIKTKKFIILLVLIFLLIGLFVIGIFYFALSHKSNGSKATESASAISSWKTYEDQQLAFSLKYPPDWSYRNEKPSWDEPGVTNKITFSVSKPALTTISLYRLSWNFSLDSFVQTQINGVLRIPEKGESLTIAGQDARQFKRVFIGKAADTSSGISTLIKRGDDLFVVESFVKSQEDNNIYNEVLKTVVFGQKKEDAKQTDAKLTSIYTNPTFGYSMKIPDGWKEAQGSDDQKRFRFYTEKQSSGRSDQTGFFKAEIQILALDYTDPAVSGNLGDINKLVALKPGEELVMGGRIVKKVKDLKIDNKDAIYLSGKSDDFLVSVSMIGKKRYVSIILQGYDQEALDKHRAEFDAAIATFKFNNFGLD